MSMRSFGAPDVLSLEELPTPEPGEGEVRIAVRAAFVARTRDVATRRGDHPVFAPRVAPPHVLGGEHAGVVDAVGRGVADDLLGTAVTVSAYVRCGTCPVCRTRDSQLCSAPTTLGIEWPGSNAEYVVVPAENVEQLPDGLSFVDAAVLAANGPIARAQLEAGRLNRGEWVLVPGASGSVGSMIVALAKQRGARVIALTRQARVAAPLEALGAELVLDAGDPDLGSSLLAHTGEGVDLVVDNLAVAGLWERYSPAIARYGRVVFSGRVGDWDQPLPVDVGRLYLQDQSLIGLRSSDGAQVTAFWTDLRTAPISMPTELIREFPLAEAAAAHAAIEQGDKLGHHVLVVEGR